MKPLPLFIFIKACLLVALPLAAQDLEIPVSKIHQNAEISQAIKSNALLLKFTEEHASDTIGIGFETRQGEKGLEWAKSTTVVLNGNEGQDGGADHSSHQVFRIQPFGPEADDEWEEYLYVVRIKSQGQTAAAIIHFRCTFIIPANAEGTEPKLDKFEVVARKSILK